jgi:hypothetical protein
MEGGGTTVLFKWLGKGGGTTAGGTRAPKAARTDTAYLGIRGMSGVR